jgi:sensor domain CHASE-containing protein
MSNIINLTQAETETHAYQNDAQFQGLTKSCAMDKSAYEQLMAQPGVVQVRTYFSLDSNSKLGVVVVGVDAQGNDMTSGVILGDSQRCPYYCPSNSSLM